MPRTDTHSPSNFDPGQYEFVGCTDLGSAGDPGFSDPEAIAAFDAAGLGSLPGGAWMADVIKAMREIYAARGLRGFDGHFLERHGCDHCGQHNVRYFSVYIHKPTNELVTVGWQ